MYWQTHSLCMAKDWWCSVQRSAPTVTPISWRTAVTFNGTSGPTKVWFCDVCVWKHFSCTVFHCLITVWSQLPSVSPSWLSSRRTDVEGNWPVGQAQTKISMFLLLASSQRWKHFKSGNANWQILHQSYETSTFIMSCGFIWKSNAIALCIICISYDVQCFDLRKWIFSPCLLKLTLMNLFHWSHICPETEVAGRHKSSTSVSEGLRSESLNWKQLVNRNNPAKHMLIMFCSRFMLLCFLAAFSRTKNSL